MLKKYITLLAAVSISITSTAQTPLTPGSKAYRLARTEVLAKIDSCDTQHARELLAFTTRPREDVLKEEKTLRPIFEKLKTERPACYDSAIAQMKALLPISNTTVGDGLATQQFLLDRHFLNMLVYRKSLMQKLLNAQEADFTAGLAAQTSASEFINESITTRVLSYEDSAMLLELERQQLNLDTQVLAQAASPTAIDRIELQLATIHHTYARAQGVFEGLNEKAFAQTLVHLRTELATAEHQTEELLLATTAASNVPEALVAAVLALRAQAKKLYAETDRLYADIRAQVPAPDAQNWLSQTYEAISSTTADIRALLADIQNLKQPTAKEKQKTEAKPEQKIKEKL